jgi:hypothetical protein
VLAALTGVGCWADTPAGATSRTLINSRYKSLGMEQNKVATLRRKTGLFRKVRLPDPRPGGAAYSGLDSLVLKQFANVRPGQKLGLAGVYFGLIKIK